MEIKQYFQILKKRWWIIILLPLIASLAAAYTSFYILKPEYKSDTTLYIINKYHDPQTGPVYNELMVGQYLVKDYRELIKSRTVTSTVIEDLKLYGMTPETLAKKISVNSKNDTRIIEISVQDENPERAREIADKVSEVFKGKVIDLMRVDNVSIVDPAQLPVEPIGPRPLRNIVISFFAGIMAAAGLIFLLEYLDDSIKNSEDVEKYLDLPVIGIIPVMSIK